MNKMNLTTLQMAYMNINNSNVSSDEKLKQYKELLKVLENNKNIKHNHTVKYRLEDKQFKLINSGKLINCYEFNKECNEYILQSSNHKQSHNSIVTGIKNKINRLEYFILQQKGMELFYTKINNMWFDSETYTLINKLYKSLNIRLTSNLTIKKDKVNNNVYGIYEDKTEYTKYIDKGEHYFVNDISVLTIREEESFIKELNVNEISNLIQELSQKELIKPCYIVNSKDNIISKITDIIDNDVKTIKEYFVNNIYPYLMNKECYSFK